MQKINYQNNAAISPKCQRCANRVGPVCFWANLGLAAFKLFCGIIGNSKALVADAVHSIADVITAGFILITLKIQGRTPDESYPYGYGKIEFIASAFIGVTLIITSILIVLYSITAIIRGDMPEPGTVAILALIIAIMGKELIHQYSLCAGMKLKSPAMLANAWESRSDVYSSIAALVMVLGARIGLRFLDPIAAVGVAVLVAKVGIKTFHEAIGGLVDRSIAEEELGEMTRIASSVEGVEGIASVKARRSGRGIWVDLDVQVKPQATVAEGNAITEEARTRIEELPQVGKAVVRFKSVGVLDK